jgi:hypothetical protein
VIHSKPTFGTSRPPTTGTRERNSALPSSKLQLLVNRIFLQATIRTNSRKTARMRTAQLCKLGFLDLSEILLYSPLTSRSLISTSSYTCGHRERPVRFSINIGFGIWSWFAYWLHYYSLGRVLESFQLVLGWDSSAFALALSINSSY